MQGQIKLISGWSNPGGSTIHHINLINLLNENGMNLSKRIKLLINEDIKKLKEL